MSDTQTLTPPTGASTDTQSGITEITVGGFKSIATKQSIEIRPLTILAGANSSGKSSFIQPLLLLKQTLEAPYDPGPLLLNGPNIKFTSGDQIIARSEPPGKGWLASQVALRVPLEVGLRTGRGGDFKATFRYDVGPAFSVLETETLMGDGRVIVLRPEMSHQEIATSINQSMPPVPPDGTWSIGRDRFWLKPRYAVGRETYDQLAMLTVAPWIAGVLHVPGLRGSMDRAYPNTGVGPTFPGTFDHYVASLVDLWQTDENVDHRLRLVARLKNIGLTRIVQARRINDTQIALYVDRLPATSLSSFDLVNIADVGFGVPTVLPVLVALIAALPGQAVYLEQPELHLHPRAQVRLADALAEAARRGVRIIAETHSSLLIRGIQTLVAKGQLDPNVVKLHWFSRSNEDGTTTVTSRDLDDNGAFGDWPMDFDEVELKSEGDYLDAVGFGRK
jgi:hypothetical protein